MGKGIFMGDSDFHSNVKYLKKSIYQVPLSRDEEHQLAKRWQLYNDQKALNKLVESHFRLVINTVYRFRNYGLPFSDLCQEGMLGLMKAASRFDPRLHDIRFSGYAKWWVKSFIQVYIMKNWSIVRIGSTTAHKQLFFHLNRLKSQLLNISFEGLSDKEMALVAETLNVSVRDVENIEKRLSSYDLSLDISYFDDKNKEDAFPDPSPGPEETAVQDNEILRFNKIIKSALKTLTQKERDIVKKRFFIEDPESFHDIGSELGISRERVRQIERKAFRKLRHDLVHKQKIRKEDLNSL